MSISSSKGEEKREVKKESNTIKDIKSDEVLHLTKAELFEVVERYSKEQGYSKTKTDSLLEDMLEEMRAQNDTPGSLVRTYKEEEIDIKDYLEKPAVFYCYSFSHICIGDTRFGHSVVSPYSRPIRFKPLYRYRKPGTSQYNEEIISMSCCILRSKKEADWVRNHTLFGIKYFENTKDAQSVDRVFADKLVEASNMLNGMSQFEVIERAKSEQLAVTPDVDEVRKRLAYHIAEKSMKTVSTKTHHTIAAADPSFNPTDSRSISEVLVQDKDLKGVGV